MTPFRWAILGTGNVSRKFCLGLATLGARAEVGPVASRNPANADAFVRSLTLGRAVQTYEEAVAADDVDAVYIATPPAFHEAHARLAIAAGKPALIEKPLAHDAASARRIAAEAEAAGLFVMEAMWTRFQPLVVEIARLVADGGIGDLRGFHGTFLGANVPDAETSLFSPESGGALLHRGVYPLSLARHLLGPVTDVTARGRIGETGVDEDTVLVLEHASGAISDIRASVRASGTNDCSIWGTQGRIDIAGPVWRPSRARHVPYRAQPVGDASPRRFEAFRESSAGQRIAALKSALTSKSRTIRAPFQGNGYVHEAIEVMDCVAAGRLTSEIMPPSQSVDIMEIVDTALSRIRERKP